MTLSAGARLGPYEILSPLGAGGMGEVYRAKDTRLERDVAVKVSLLRVAIAILITLVASMISALEMADDQRSDAGKPASPLLALDAVEIGPSNPGPTTLCTLRVRIRNMGSHEAASFLFGVRINGQDQTAYKSVVYFQTIASGTVGEVQLYNFWATDSGRPMPNDGQLRVEVTLNEAQWVEVRTEGKVTEYKVLGNVADLPIALGVIRPLVSSKGR